MVTCSEKIFESIALIQLSFSPDEELNERIASVESLLTKADEIASPEALRDRVLWAMSLTDAEAEINARQKQRVAQIVMATKPVEELLNCLQLHIKQNSR